MRCLPNLQKIEASAMEDYFGSSTASELSSSRSADCGYILFYQARELSLGTSSLLRLAAAAAAGTKAHSSS